MMEKQPWPAKYQQSGPGIDTTHDSLNNGESNDNEIAVGCAEDSTEGAQEAPLAEDSDTAIISEKGHKLITATLKQMEALSTHEKYLLHLKLFQINNVEDPLRQPLNPLGSRSEINRTISYIKTHLEEDPETSLPKQEVYDEYSNYCHQNQIKSLSQADFGKVMKQVYPKVRARRLGTRGNSRYCYSGLRRCLKLPVPKLPDLADKPMSTETPCTQSSLTAAAWFIVKEWSEAYFRTSFSSLQALAWFLVVNHSVGVGSEAASQLTAAPEAEIKGENAGGKLTTKERDLLQLRKKIQQKNEVKERKRKMQSPKSEPRAAAVKRSRSVASAIRPETSPILTGCGESSTSTSTGSTSTSPTQGKPICDKSYDFTSLPALPDFKSFQKPACEQAPAAAPPQRRQSSPCTSNGLATKVAIPRLAPGMKQQQQQRSPHSSPKKSSGKYKAIQPKPQLCDNASYNPQSTADIRSQGVLHNVDRFKERKSSDEDDCDAPVFPLTRERLNSISNVDKNAMDEYLDTNHSQHEEELSKYFSNNITDNAGPHLDANATTAKLSQLRQLLQTGISDNSSKNVVLDTAPPTITTISQAPIEALVAQAVVANVPYVVPTQTNLTAFPTNVAVPARPRVPFQEEAVPPSPNTRRKNFSFLPISPGPQSPKQCSSTNVSPFVSPRNTPVPRTKNTTHQNAGLGVAKKSKCEPILVDGLGMAATVAAPNSKSVLEKLLHSNSKIPYRPDYGKSDITALMDKVAASLSRSQSVPLGQMDKSSLGGDDLELLTPTTNNDFNDFDPIPETETVTVSRIIDALDDPQCDGASDIALYNTQCIGGFQLMDNNNLEMGTAFDFTPCPRALARSQSIDVNICYDLKCTNGNPSRSVPSTPLPFNQTKPAPVKIYQGAQSSRSYPSTPALADGATFDYTPVKSDCLLNGQPIRTNGARLREETINQSDNLTFLIQNFSEDNAIDRPLTAEEEFSISRALQGNDFSMVEMDENDVLIDETTYNGN